MAAKDTTKTGRMTKHAARQWIRQHWAVYMEEFEAPDNCPPEVAELWRGECYAMADRIASPSETQKWREENGR